MNDDFQAILKISHSSNTLIFVTYIYVICLEYSILTTENIYICTSRKSTNNTHKVMYSEKVFYFYTKFST